MTNSVYKRKQEDLSMKRSEINQIMEDSLEFIEKENKFLLPPFARWTCGIWQKKGEECRDIMIQQLGWDITDFGSGDFRNIGLSIFTVRNGTIDELKKENGKIYAEKIMIVDEQQKTPCHFHYQKMEDIINRGGGVLTIQVWNSTKDDQLDMINDVIVSMDGVKVRIKAGNSVELKPGDSITVPTRLYHKFWGKKNLGRILAGEISRVNDDYIDNHFHEKVGRFADIEEDAEPLFLLYNDYKKYCKFV
jgi:D-lyxose ketol-isomerase